MSFDLLKTHTPITYTMVLQCICFYVSQQGAMRFWRSFGCAFFIFRGETWKNTVYAEKK